MSDDQQQPAGQGRGARLSPWWKIALSVVIALHLTAVFVAPWSLPPSSRLSQATADVFRPYVEAAHLLHGYRFFAPQPDSSHLIEYELKFADGTKRTGRLPDLKDEWPRLFYHRHFMLSEFLNGNMPGDPPPKSDRGTPAYAELVEAHNRQTRLSDAFANSYAQYLMRANGAIEVKLTLIEHLLPRVEQLRAGSDLTDPRSYRMGPSEVFSVHAETVP